MTDPTVALVGYLSRFALHLDSRSPCEGIPVLIQSLVEAEPSHRIPAQP